MPSFWRPSKLDPDGLRLIPEADLNRLLLHLGELPLESWMAQQRRQNHHLAALDQWHPDASADWLWSLGLPILSLAKLQGSQRTLLGLSALPGCGKTSFGAWLGAAASSLNLSVEVVSIDDFYFEAERLDQAMAGNPWGVPRALPGSHDMSLLLESLTRWKAGQRVEFPCFDKAQRQGRGDRIGWRDCNADFLVLEGWFVGCLSGDDPTAAEAHLVPPLTSAERLFRATVQESLRAYEPIWNLCDRIWQLRAISPAAPMIWKRQQEATMQAERGVSLDSTTLQAFIRMILCSIPSESFQRIPAEAVFMVDPSRALQGIHVQP